MLPDAAAPSKWEHAGRRLPDMASANRLFNGSLMSKVAKADAKSDSGPPSPVVGMRKVVSGVLQVLGHMQFQCPPRCVC